MHYFLCCLVFLPLFNLKASDKLILISPHRKSIQNEFVSSFQKHYKKKYKKNVDVDWIDQGGTENNLRFIINRFKKNNKTSLIDVFWGGGEVTFYDLEQRNLLLPYKLSSKLNKKLPQRISNLELRGSEGHWYATALSSFGIFYNKRVLSLLKMPEPKTWFDLYKSEYFDYISVADPRQSSSSLMMSLIMLNSLGWKQGWKLLNSLAGNTRRFTHSSSDPIKAVLSGDAAIATAIDFYATPKVNAIGSQNLGFTLPSQATIFNCDPAAILKGAPNKLVAQRFMRYILSLEAQRIFVYPKGHIFGPKKSTLGRISIRPDVYLSKDLSNFGVVNPFKIKRMKLKLNLEKIVQEKKIISEAIGTFHVDLHKAVRKAWQKTLNTSSKKAKEIYFEPPFSKKEMLIYLSHWNNAHYRSELKNSWMQKAKKKYEKIIKLTESVSLAKK